MTAPNSSGGALSDLRIIDLTRMLAGPFATMLLADQGAEVIKIEPPEGDMTRDAGPFHSDDLGKRYGGYFESVNRNKRGICLDLKRPEGREALFKLVATSDAIVENFRSGVMERLGLGYETLRAINPRIVYGALRGFGDPRTGASPYVNWPAFDVVAQAMGGVMAITGPDSLTPTKVGPGLGDIAPGMFLAFGVLSGIHHARRTGVGQFVDVAMTDAVLAVCERTVYQHAIGGLTPGPEGNHHPFIAPFGMFPAADGFVTIAAQQDDHFTILCDALGCQGMLGDTRYAGHAARGIHRRELIVDLAAITCRFTKAELQAKLGGRVAFGPVMDISDIASDPHFTAREMMLSVDRGLLNPTQIAGFPIKMTTTPCVLRSGAPTLGADTRQYLRAVGLSDDEIDLVVNDRTSKLQKQEDSNAL